MQNLEEQQKVETPQLTKADNNQSIIRWLAGIAFICVGVSAAVIFTADDVKHIRDILAITFVPVGTIVGGFIGRLTS